MSHGVSYCTAFMDDPSEFQFREATESGKEMACQLNQAKDVEKF